MIVYKDSKEMASVRRDIEDNTNKILNLSKQIKSGVDSLYRLAYSAESDSRRQNPYIVKSVIKYMAKGLNKDDAILMTARDFETDEFRVSTIFWSQNRYMSAVNLYAKRYLCEKLKKNGFTAKRIGKIIGVSENHVFKILRANADFWFLKK